MTTPLPAVKHEVNGHRAAFFLEVEGERLAEMTLTRVNEHHWIIDHTEVSDVLRGQGAGRVLLDAAVAWARQTSTRFTPLCPFARSQFDKYASLRDVLAS
jgi:uncharacterized protein